MSLETIVQALGGLALFLFAMQRMTEGLTVFAGSGLKQLLGRWTSTLLRGVFAGILVTGLVQSSSAVTIATIGFVNAGMLTLRQALLDDLRATRRLVDHTTAASRKFTATENP